MKALQQFGRRLRRRTGGSVVLHFYPGGILGDERDMIRAMRRGRIQAAALTSTGIGQVEGAIRMLELPLLLRDVKQLRHIRKRFASRIGKALHRRGFELLAWIELGWIRFFSRRPIRTMSALRAARFWSWADDRLARHVASKLQLQRVPLAVQDVLPALQTGVVDAVYGSAYTTLALQWHTQLRYFSTQRLLYGIGGVVMTRRAFEALAPTQRRMLLSEGAHFSQRQGALARKEDKLALAQLARVGLLPVRSSSTMERELLRIAPLIWTGLAGKLYPKRWFDELMAVTKAALAAALRDGKRRSRRLTFEDEIEIAEQGAAILAGETAPMRHLSQPVELILVSKHGHRAAKGLALVVSQVVLPPGDRDRIHPQTSDRPQRNGRTRGEACIEKKWQRDHIGIDKADRSVRRQESRIGDHLLQPEADPRRDIDLAHAC